MKNIIRKIFVMIMMMTVITAFVACGSKKPAKDVVDNNLQQEGTSNEDNTTSNTNVEDTDSENADIDDAGSNSTQSKEDVENTTNEEQTATKQEQTATKQEQMTTKQEQTTKKPQETTNKKPAQTEEETTSKKTSQTEETTTDKQPTYTEETTEEETTEEYIEPYINKTEIVYWGGNTVETGLLYKDTGGVIDWSQQYIELHVYGVDREDIVWSSANTAIATVEDGLVKVHKYGKTVITAQVDGMTFQCDVNVKMICTYYYVDYSATIQDMFWYSGKNAKDHWIWFDWFWMNKGTSIRYKITEKEYDENGKFQRETDITQNVLLECKDDNFCEIDTKNGIITGVGVNEYSNRLEFVLTSHEAFRYEANGYVRKEALDDVEMIQKVYIFLNVDEEGICDDTLEIVASRGYTEQGVFIDEYFALELTDWVGMFSWDDEFIPMVSWYYFSTPLDTFTWYSSDESVIKIGEPLGSGHVKFGATSFDMLSTGYSTITVKRGDKVIGQVKVEVTKGPYRFEFKVVD